MLKTNNAMEAMRYLLMKCENDRKFIYGEINTLLNTSGFALEDLIRRVEVKIDSIVVLESKYTILHGLFKEASEQLNNAQGAPTEE